MFFTATNLRLKRIGHDLFWVKTEKEKIDETIVCLSSCSVYAAKPREACIHLCIENYQHVYSDELQWGH